MSKVKKDSEEDSDSSEDEDDPKDLKEVDGKQMTYKQYLQFLENESHFDELGEES